MAEVSAFGVSVDVPRGWDCRLYPSSTGTMAQGIRPTAEASTGAILHIADFPLPEGRGDFGSGAVEVMAEGNVLLCLLEYGPEEANSALFPAGGIPRFRSGEFSSLQMQRPVVGMAGAQRFFTIGERAFCLYAVLGSQRLRRDLVPRLNRIIDSLRVD